MKLDNRPKKLLVKGAAAETLQGVRDWYEAVGMLDAVDTLENGDVLVAFKTRSAAEQVCPVIAWSTTNADGGSAGSCEGEQHPDGRPGAGGLARRAHTCGQT